MFLDGQTVKKNKQYYRNDETNANIVILSQPKQNDPNLSNTRFTSNNSTLKISCLTRYGEPLRNYNIIYKIGAKHLTRER